MAPKWLMKGALVAIGGWSMLSNTGADVWNSGIEVQHGFAAAAVAAAADPDEIPVDKAPDRPAPEEIATQTDPGSNRELAPEPGQGIDEIDAQQRLTRLQDYLHSRRDGDTDFTNAINGYIDIGNAHHLNPIDMVETIETTLREQLQSTWSEQASTDNVAAALHDAAVMAEQQSARVADNVGTSLSEAAALAEVQAARETENVMRSIHDAGEVADTTAHRQSGNMGHGLHAAAAAADVQAAHDTGNVGRGVHDAAAAATRSTDDTTTVAATPGGNPTKVAAGVHDAAAAAEVQAGGDAANVGAGVHDAAVAAEVQAGRDAANVGAGVHDAAVAADLQAARHSNDVGRGIGEAAVAASLDAQCGADDLTTGLDQAGALAQIQDVGVSDDATTAVMSELHDRPAPDSSDRPAEVAPPADNPQPDTRT